MEINYLGLSSFRIRTNKGIIVFNPFDDIAGFRFAKTTADIVIFNEQNKRNGFKAKISPQKREELFLVNAPGQFEISGIEIQGLTDSSNNEAKNGERPKNTIYLVEAEGIRVCHLGTLSGDLSDKKTELLGDIDILIAFALKGEGLSPQKMAQLTKRMAPSIVIPAGDQITEFLDAMDSEGLKPEDKLQIKKEELPEETTVKILSVK